MRLARFIQDDRSGYGVVVDRYLRALPTRAPAAFADLAAAVAADGGAALIGLASASVPVALDDVAFGLPLPEAGRIICVGRNYKKHVREVDADIPATPSIFLRTIDSIVPAGAAIMRPRVSEQLDYEGELAVVIGREGRHIPADAALDHVLGYTCFNDGSVRDYQFGHSLTSGKNFHRSGSAGPWIVTADEIADPAALVVKTRIDGCEMQSASLDDLIFDVPMIISYVSSLFPLVPGDLIATGTPEGVGFARNPQRWLKPGDRLEIEITGIGILRNSIVEEGERT